LAIIFQKEGIYEKIKNFFFSAKWQKCTTKNKIIDLDVHIKSWVSWGERYFLNSGF
jgi:uncharacterized protein YutD